MATADCAFLASRKGNDNRLDFKLFLDALDALRVHVPYHSALQIFAEAGGDEDGWIDQDEFAMLTHARVNIVQSR